MSIIRSTHLLSSIALCLLAACGGGGGGASISDSLTTTSRTAQSTGMDIGPVAVQAGVSPLPADWYRNAVFAQIYLRGYQDSDGDGTGDINGLISRLDYLKDLGIKGIWLLPIFKSGTHDHGYDITDYRGLDPEFGSEADLKRLFDEAHARGIGIVLDYVMNHGSSASPLFYDSTYSLADKRYWYNWQSVQPRWDWMQVNPWYPANGAYYYAVFTDFMPDFNLKNETVVQYHFNSMNKWLNLGADGFRMDAVQNFIENEYLNENQPQTLALLKRVRTSIDQYPNRFMVCEDAPDPVLAVNNGCTSAFYFGMHSALVSSAKTGVVDSNLVGYLKNPNIAKMSTLLANHDTYFGIRLYNQFGGNEARYKLAAASLLTLPGTPFVYYGEEIGMGMASGAGSITDHQLRPPMSWNSTPGKAGFSTATPFRALADNSTTHNVATEAGNPNSLLSTYKQLIGLRNAEAALRQGEISVLTTGNSSVLAFTRTLGSERVLVVINYADKDNSVALDLTSAGTWMQRYPVTTGKLVSDINGAATTTIPATTAQVFKLGS